MLIEEGTRFLELKDKRDAQWARIAESAEWFKYTLGGDYDRRFYAIYLIETYHYVKHNPKHQALVATRMDEMPVHYMKFCYEHAEEETGHELMAFHDLLNLGVSIEAKDLPAPLASTQILISYLYNISETGNPLRRLGYSFWAEDSYQYIQSVLGMLTKTLSLTNKHTSFLVSHSTIDQKHSQEIEEMLNKFCQTDEDWESIGEVLEITLRLQSDMMNQVVDEYDKLINGAPSRYSFLNTYLA